jgi:hypothetical protein
MAAYTAWAMDKYSDAVSLWGVALKLDPAYFEGREAMKEAYEDSMTNLSSRGR